MMRRTKPKPPAPWPPAHRSLPDLATLEALSKPGGGAVVQQPLFPGALDVGTVARLRRLLAPRGRATVEGLLTRAAKRR
jgi:hypothetical protein